MSDSPKVTANRRRQMRRMRRASSVSATCDADSVESAAAAAADSTLQLRFKSLVRRQGSSFRMAAGLLVSHCRRRSTGFSSGGDSLGDISIGASSLRSVQTERKAVKVLGTMFRAFGTMFKVLGTMFMLFFISWASFFSMNLAMGLCPTCHFEELLYKWFLWLGYSSSILNPIIYTVFNRAFKQTFLRLLTCGLKRTPSRDATGGQAWSDGGGGGGGSRHRCSSFGGGSERNGGSERIAVRRPVSRGMKTGSEETLQTSRFRLRLDTGGEDRDNETAL